MCVLALVDTLEYLKRGGRISKTTALAGGLLNIKPVLTIENGEILLVGKARGSRQGNNLLVEKIRACGGIDFSLPILLGYTGLTDVFLKKYVEDSRAHETGRNLVCRLLLEKKKKKPQPNKKYKEIKAGIGKLYEDQRPRERTRSRLASCACIIKQVLYIDYECKQVK